jgi:hypothetical protein
MAHSFLIRKPGKEPEIARPFLMSPLKISRAATRKPEGNRFNFVSGWRTSRVEAQANANSASRTFLRSSEPYCGGAVATQAPLADMTAPNSIPEEVATD